MPAPHPRALLAGPLVDQVFVPLMEAGGPLAGSLGPIFGVDEGPGIAVRHLEDELPDMVPDATAAGCRPQIVNSRPSPERRMIQRVNCAHGALPLRSWPTQRGDPCRRSD